MIKKNDPYLSLFFQFTFGIDDDGIVIDDVELPKWASTPEEFVMLHRAVSVLTQLTVSTVSRLPSHSIALLCEVY